MKRKKRKSGFTLAEVLIVLVILGVIAAICVQSMKTYNAQQKGFDTKFDKAVSMVGQTAIMIILEDSYSDDMTGMFDSAGKFSIADANSAARTVATFKKHMVVDDAPIDLTDKYFTGDLLNYKKVSQGKLQDKFSNFFYLQDGTLYGFKFHNSCSSSDTVVSSTAREGVQVGSICASIFVDVNGEKKPNKLGSDQFIIPIDTRGVNYGNKV